MEGVLLSEVIDRDGVVLQPVDALTDDHKLGAEDDVLDAKVGAGQLQMALLLVKRESVEAHGARDHQTRGHKIAHGAVHGLHLEAAEGVQDVLFLERNKVPEAKAAYNIRGDGNKVVPSGGLCINRGLCTGLCYQ